MSIASAILIYVHKYRMAAFFKRFTSFSVYAMNGFGAAYYVPDPARVASAYGLPNEFSSSRSDISAAIETTFRSLC